MPRNLFIVVLFVLLTACGKNPQAVEGPLTPITFSASVNQGSLPGVDTHWNEGPSYDSALGVSTKASGEISTLSALCEGGFGVFASYTGLYHYSESSVTSDFMHNQEVTWNGSDWEYDPVKYWPNEVGGHVSFFAYAPFSDGDPDNGSAGYCIPSFSHAKEQTDPWIIYRIHTDPAQQVDLLYSLPVLDQTRPEPAYKLPFDFRHALACVGDDISVNIAQDVKTKLDAFVSGSDMYDDAEILLSNVTVTYTLIEKARLTLWNRGQANWSPVLSETGLTTRTVEYFNGERSLYRVSTAYEGSWSDSGNGVYYIPLVTESEHQTANVQVTYLIRTYNGGDTIDTEHPGDVTLTLKNFPDAYAEGKKLDIHVTLN